MAMMAITYFVVQKNTEPCGNSCRVHVVPVFLSFLPDGVEQIHSTNNKYGLEWVKLLVLLLTTLAVLLSFW